MRRSVALAASLFLTLSSFAVAPQFSRVRSAEDFLSRGELRPAPSLKKVATFTDPFVLSQVAAPNGDHFFGTGNDGKVYRLRGSEMKLLYTAPEPEIYALAFRDNALYVGTSPNGKVYRVDPESGKSALFFDPKQAYIWALAFLGNGDLAIGTGVDGKLLRVTPKGESKVFFDSPETHIRSLALRKDGTLLVGAAGKGRIYEVRDDGSAHALYDSALSEISAMYVDANGIGWAAGVSNILPSSAPAPKTAKPATATATSTTTSGSETKKDEGTATVEVTYSFDDSSSSSSTAAQAGSGELYKINPDGFVEIARRFEREMVYAIDAGRNGSVLLSTGPQGRAYEVKDGEAALVAAVPEKQIVSLSVDNGATLITTTNSGAVYRMESTPSAKAEFRSVAKDVERFSRFGHYRIEGTDVGDGHLAIAFRSGNTRTPDATWSPWGATKASAEGSIDTPAGKFVQWRLTMPKPASDITVDSVSIGFINRNIAPAIDSVSVADPAVVYISSAYPSSPQVVEATNPDEYGIFTSLDTPREKNDPGKKVYRKGFRTIVWRAHDENNDTLRYSVAFRRTGTEPWLRLRDNLEETQLNFDTSQLPDGRYELKVSATDAQDNPENPLTDTKEAVEFTVDNTPPRVMVTTAGDDITIRITDLLGTIGKVEYSADAQKWIRLTPLVGIADSSDETYRLPRTAIRGKFVIVRAVDSFYNVATESVDLK